MRCNLTPTMRQAYLDAGDARVAAHVVTCPECQAELAALARVEANLGALPVVDAPPAVRVRMARLEAATQGRALCCAETLDLLEPYREGDLDATTTFLVEDHLLACRPCATALAQSEELAVALRALPMLVPPETIAERIAAARVPWWQKLLPAPRVTWRVGWSLAGLALLLAVGQQAAPRLARVLQPAKPTPIHRAPQRDEQQARLVTPPTPRDFASPVAPAHESDHVTLPVVHRPPAHKPEIKPEIKPDPPKREEPVAEPAPVASAETDISNEEWYNTVMDAGKDLSDTKSISAMGPSIANPAS